ncbi:MAG: DUF6789 family protein [Terriglobales bacterium]
MPTSHNWPPPRSAQSTGAVVGGGAIAGAIGGAVMLIVAMSWTAAVHLGSEIIPRTTAAALSGPMGLISSRATVWQGWLMYLAAAAVLGLIYTAIGWNVRKWRTAIIWGVLYGICVWVIMTAWLLPAHDHVMAAYVALMPGPWFVLHLIYGAVLSVSAPIRRGLAGAQPRPAVWTMPKAS